MANYARLLTTAAGLPGASRTAHALARWRAGRHYVAATGVVIDGDSVLLARHRFRADQWALPGGWVRRREDPRSACEREIAEEIGIEVRAEVLIAGELHAVDGVAVRYGGLTLAYWCVPVDPVDPTPMPASIEISDVRWVSRQSCSDYVGGFQLTAIDAAYAAARRRG